MRNPISDGKEKEIVNKQVQYLTGQLNQILEGTCPNEKVHIISLKCFT